MVLKFLTMYNLLEQMNINYQLNKHAITIQDDTGTVHSLYKY